MEILPNLIVTKQHIIHFAPLYIYENHPQGFCQCSILAKYEQILFVHYSALFVPNCMKNGSLSLMSLRERIASTTDCKKSASENQSWTAAFEMFSSFKDPKAQYRASAHPHIEVHGASAVRMRCPRPERCADRRP